MTASTNLKQMRQSLRSSNAARTVRVAHSDIGYLYRYDTSWVNKDWPGNSYPIFQCWEYPIISETLHTYLIFDGSKKRRIYKGNSKGWAHKTIVAARTHYVRRKSNQLNIIEQQRDSALTVLRTLREEWGVGSDWDLPDTRTINQVYEAELAAQRMEDQRKRTIDLYGDGAFKP